MVTSTESPSRGGLVVDCSVAIAWFLVDEQNDLAARIAGEADRYELWAPPLWLYELTNALDVARKRGRLSHESWAEAIREAERAPVRIDPVLPGTVELAELAAAHRLTSYDAAYLELALRRKMRLATLDVDLAAAAAERGVRFAFA